MKAILLSGLLSMLPCERPPVQFQNGPPPATILFADPQAVDAICREATGKATMILACTNGARRIMLMPNPCLYEDAYAKLLCHEAAHLNGWRHG